MARSGNVNKVVGESGTVQFMRGRSTTFKININPFRK